MIIGVVRESKPGETRVAATPATVGQLRKLGYEVVIAPGAGELSDFPDEGFVEAGATIGDAWQADIVFGINPPSEEELARMKPGATVIALLAPMLNPDVVEVLAGSRSRRCRWTRCPASPARSRWTCSPRWPTSPVIAR